MRLGTANTYDNTLDQGVQWCEATLGATPGAGGRHALMGTHNRFFKIAFERYPQTYFEIIAIDPDAPAPLRHIPLKPCQAVGLRDVQVTAGTARLSARLLGPKGPSSIHS